MTPKRPNIISRTLGMLIAAAGIGRSTSKAVESTMTLKNYDDASSQKVHNLPPPKYKGKGVCISNGTGKIQTTGTGWQQRFYRVKIRAHKSLGLRRCDSEGNFINRKSGARIAA